jgi:hypothetical protein
MANIGKSLYIYPDGSTGSVKMGLYNYNTTSSSGGNYHHFKSNVALNTNIMTYLEFVGENYTLAVPIRAAFVSYSYSYLIAGVENYHTGGATADGVYVSSDNYFVYRVAVPSTTTDMAFTFNAIHVNPTGNGHDFNFTAVSRSSSTTVY